MKIFLIRHCETQDDLINCYGGTADWDITENGQKQVENFRPTFETFDVEKIFVSPLKRSRKSAEILNKNISLPLEEIFDLCETSYGYLTGVEKNLAKELFGYLLKKPEHTNVSYYNRNCMPGGELPDDLDKRIENAIKTITDKSKELKSIAIITHGNVLRSIFWNILKEKREVLHMSDMAYAEIIFTNNNFKVVKTEGFKFSS